jgi:hypothetical protein
MPGSVTGLLPASLFSLILLVILLLAHEAYRMLRFHSLMRSLANDLHLHYSQPIFFRPPSVNGFYRGRDVAFDVVGGDVRARVFHVNESNEEFTVGTIEYFKTRGPSGAIKLDIGNSELEAGYLFRGTRMDVLRKFLDDGLQRRLSDSGISFCVGQRDVSSRNAVSSANKATLRRTIDFLVEAAARADRI